MIPMNPTRDARDGAWPDPIRARMFEQRVVLVNGELDDALAGSVATELMTLDACGDGAVRLLLNSGGGTFEAAFTLIDVIDLLGVPVHATCIGRAEGAALGVLAVAARRLAIPHAPAAPLRTHECVRGPGRRRGVVGGAAGTGSPALLRANRRSVASTVELDCRRDGRRTPARRARSGARRPDRRRRDVECRVGARLRSAPDRLSLAPNPRVLRIVTAYALPMKRLATFGVGSATYLLVVVGTHSHAVGRAGVDAHSVHRNWSPRTVCGRRGTSWLMQMTRPSPSRRPTVAPVSALTPRPSD